MIRSMWKELLVLLCAALGWLLIIWGIASLTTVWVFPIGIGIGLLGTVGYRMLYIIVVNGLYILSQQQETDESNKGSGNRGKK